ncbi:tyrosine-type recombinase/integrase [Candidatus Woesearchaeota archaeon]|nr:tyrosine-type recombinase/integrase [Candidatus Woesearchaeota archaeon]
MQEEDIKAYLAHLMADKKLKPASVNLALCSLRFFYQEILEKEIFKKVKSPKSEKKLPTVLTKDEIKALLDSTKNKKHHLLIEMLYSSGLRVSEAVSIKVNDLDLNERVGRVISGKGKKDRLIILSNNIIEHIEKYLKKREKKGYKSEFLFNVKNPEKHLSIRQAQKIIQKAAKKANIKKRVFCHALRSSFATHLLESGVDIRVIQELLGHSNLQTTERYTKVSTEQIKKVRSPLDNL